MRFPLLAFVLLSLGCTHTVPTKPAAKAEPRPPTGSTAAVASAPPDAGEPPPPATIPELSFEPFRVEDKPLKHVFAIDGATIVTTDNVVGYIDGDRVEWIAKVPKDRPHIGHNIIEHVDGKYLDSIDVIFTTDNGRALSPIWLPLTGKGTLHDEAPYGGFGSIREARIGDSVLIATHSSFNNDRILTVRGPKLVRKFANVKPCTASFYKEQWIQASIDEHALVPPEGFGATAAGTLVAIGDRCMSEGVWAEVWAPNSTTSRLVDLRPLLKHTSLRMMMLRMGEDGLWIWSGEFEPILQFQNGEFKTIPSPEAPVSNVFLSSKGELHARAADEVLRFDNGKWVPVARFASFPARGVNEFVMDDKGRFWAANYEEAFRLRETKQVPAEHVCTGWFVRITEQDTTHTKKQQTDLEKMVASYAKKDGVKLVIGTDYPWMIGASFANKADAEAFAAHAATAFPNDKPVAYCSGANPPRLEDYPKKESPAPPP